MLRTKSLLYHVISTVRSIELIELLDDDSLLLTRT
jgi:hypothetical protein